MEGEAEAAGDSCLRLQLGTALQPLPTSLEARAPGEGPG